MATVTKSKMTQVRSLVGGTPTPLTFGEAATQTYVQGEVVFLSGGYCTEIAGDTPSQILGVAGQAANNDAVANTHETSVFLAQPSTVFEANLLATGLADYVLTAADVGKYVGIQRDTTNSKVYLNVTPPNGGANVRACIIGIDTRTSAVGDTNARVHFVWLQNFVQMNSTS